MNKYLISLDKDVKRRDLFFTQPYTRDFQIFSAVNTMQNEWEELSEKFDIEHFELTYGRKATKGEVGCTLSHLAVYELILQDKYIREQDYCLICEDDVLFNQDFQQKLTALLAQQRKADIILVGQSKINQFKDIELEINYPTTFSFLCNKIKNTPFKYSYPYRNYFAGTVAYLIKKSAVRKILKEKEKNGLAYWLADDFILFGEEFCLDILIIRPLMAIENPKLVSNLQAVRGSESNNLLKKLIKYPLKKILAVKRNLSIK
ncbi:glycosyltransferase family 25 protein [Rodentibacter caecimuris]|uniref:Lsg locus protein 4 n=1 Tax=Rodentibacter caecimuris TaxID=1796644 RepID=A0ABX3KYB0_9PAST|nr:Lsg locus protein 4 [Rodentibacter heylii]